MYVCVLTHCKITRPIVMLYQRRKPKREEKRPLHLVPYIHSTYTLNYIYLYYTTHKHIHTHTQKANDIKLTLFVRLFVCLPYLSRAIQTRLLYITIFSSFACKIHKTINLFSPLNSLFYTYIHTPFLFIYLLHFFIFQCMSVGVSREQTYISNCHYLVSVSKSIN